jgi:hypothetical protein
MNKIFLGLAIVAAIAIAWFILNPGDTFDYVVTVDSEISELEDELATLDAQVAAGTLTEGQATAAKVSIVTRLNAINTAASESERAQLTPAQRAQLVDGLERLKVILVTYQETLATVEASANETNVKAELTRRGGSYNRTKPLSLVVADTIADVEETVQDSVQDYEANAELDAQIDDVVAEAEADVAMEEEGMSDEEPMDETDMESTGNDSASEGGVVSTTTNDTTDEELEVSSEIEVQTTQ